MSSNMELDPGSIFNPNSLPIEDWIDKLMQKNVHPVLVFGTSYSGKTTMLQSLLCYARNGAGSGIDISYGEPVFYDNSTASQDRVNEGRAFFERGVSSFKDGNFAPPTSKDYPFFIPVTIMIKGERFKLAFMEGNGEWYQPRSNTGIDQPLFDDFKAEISSLILKFKKPISVIFIATTDAGPLKEKHKSDEGISNCIEQYKNRTNGDRDNLLLLISKWDVLCDPADPKSKFADAGFDDVVDEIKKWRFIWPKYSTMKTANPDAKALMPYSAEWIKNNQIVARDKTYDVIFDKFNRTLWNWLYGNVKSVDRADGPRAVLYPDVDAPSGPNLRPYLALASTLLWLRTNRSGV